MCRGKNLATVEAFADVDVQALAAWLQAIPEAEWPKMADERYRGWGDRFRPLATALMVHFPGCALAGLGLWTLEPGQRHPAHCDEQPPDWVTRVHVPIVSNPLATVTTAEGEMHMKVGKAYRFNTRETHAVENAGATPRVHFVFDVKQGPQP